MYKLWLPYFASLFTAAALILFPSLSVRLMRLVGRIENDTVETIALRTGIILIGVYFTANSVWMLFYKIIDFVSSGEKSGLVLIEGIIAPIIGIATILLVPMLTFFKLPITVPNK